MWGKANEAQQEHNASMEAYRRYEDVRRLLKPLCIAVTLVLAFLAYPAVYKVEAAVHPSQTLANAQIRPQVALKAQIRQYVIQQAKLYGINPSLATCVVSHESQWIPDKLGPEKGGWVSQGLWQIYAKAWPNITRAQTFDVTWSTNWALAQIKNGHIKWWSTFDEYCSSTPVFQ